MTNLDQVIFIAYDLNTVTSKLSRVLVWMKYLLAEVTSLSRTKGKLGDVAAYLSNSNL